MLEQWLAPGVLSPPRTDPHAQKTRCEECHSPEGWERAAFPHERTGFPLRGAHERTECKACHVQDVSFPVSRTCGGCHRDVHRSDFGQRCEGCHTEDTWRALFSVDAHRRTNFPLVGRHASLPCTECHAELRNARFVRTTVDCKGCHSVDLARASLAGVNHAALGFPDTCRDCHGAFTFKGAQFSGHDRCFQIAGGPHAAVGCLQCHSSLPAVAAAASCNTQTAACAGCHEHLCAREDVRHRKVAGYQCKDQKCYACHRMAR